MSRLLAAVASLGLLAGCGADDGSARGTGELVVRERLPAQPRYIEGSLAFLRVESAGGEVVFDGPATDGTQVRGRDPLLVRSLAPGEYRIESHQRPCQGNCSFLDPPADRCRAEVEVRPGETLVATVVLAQAGGCAIRAG